MITPFKQSAFIEPALLSQSQNLLQSRSISAKPAENIDKKKSESSQASKESTDD